MTSNDKYGKTQLAGCSENDVIAKEFQYHRSCYRDISRLNNTKVVEKDIDEDEEEEEELDEQLRKECFDELKEYVQFNVIEKGQFIRMATLAQHYSKIQQQKDITPKGDITRNLKTRLINKFSNDISFFQKAIGSPEIMYCIHESEENIILTEEDKVKALAKLLKSKIDLLIPDSSWPTNPDSVRAENVKIPDLLGKFLKHLLSNKTVVSSRVDRLVKSIGQDIIYNATRGKNKTVKQQYTTRCICKT